MKKFLGYIILMSIIVVVLPLIIVNCFPKIEEPFASESKSSKTIKVYVADQKKVVKMKLEDYVIGVVAAEMPASYEPEALKAQAIAARTYALGRANKLYVSSADTTHASADVCTSPAHCQAWISKSTAMRRWGLLSSFKYWSKICKAVKATEGEVLVYNNLIINPLFHSNSGGHTENVEDVWGGAPEPYLKGVNSPGEDTSSEYKNEVRFDQDEMVKTLKGFNSKIALKNNDLLSNIQILEYSDGNRVMKMKIGNITIKGTEFRNLFKLKSTNFKLSKLSDGKISITTLGYGHGVGMSQCGANYLAKKGYSCNDILKYYYKGVEITEDK
jgi:stage II sporulation protein D